MGRPGKSKRKQPKMKSTPVPGSTTGGAISDLRLVDNQQGKPQENSKNELLGKSTMKSTPDSKKRKKN